MTVATDAIDATIAEVDRLSRVLGRAKSIVQVRSSDERGLAKATSLAWFNNHRDKVTAALSPEEIEAIDQSFRTLIESSDKQGSRAKYLATLKLVRRDLVKLRSVALVTKAKQVPSANLPPDFNPLVTNHEMNEILIGRWNECTLCLEARVPLAATVMMGGLLEGLLLARINKESNKAPIFTANAAPRDKANSTKPLSEWMLKDYIAVAHELSWISVSAKDVGVVLRDYRNYIHPHKQLSHKLKLSPDDASLLWEVSKSIARQVIKS